MSDSNKKNPSEDIMAALMAELKLDDIDDGDSSVEKNESDTFELSEASNSGVAVDESAQDDGDLGLLDLDFGGSRSSKENTSDLSGNFEINLSDVLDIPDIPSVPANINIIEQVNDQFRAYREDEVLGEASSQALAIESQPHLSLVASEYSEKTVALNQVERTAVTGYGTTGDRTVAVAGYSNRSSQGSEENVKISVGQSGGGQSSYGGWGSTDSNLAQAENLKIAQSKILELERENEKIRHQNEELVSASEIIKERSDLLTAQVYEYKNDRDALESSFKNEMALIKSQLNRKDSELQKAQMKIEELDSRLKFDMKKIRIRERELENRLELIRAEKNALVRIKDEQILESRRKLDQLQLEVDSYRQKCVELNRVIETNQDSFKRTTRALRLAMANLELQEENKTPLKKVD